MQLMEISVKCTCAYPARIYVPDGLGKAEAIEWANKNKKEIMRPFGETYEWLKDDEIDPEFAEFI